MALIVGGIPITAPSGAQSGDQTGGPELPFLLFETSASMATSPFLDGGNGTEENPYRFEDLTIRTPFRGIVVQDSHAHVVFRNITVEGYPITDSQAENLTDEEDDIYYPLAGAVNLHEGDGDDPRKIRGIQLTNAENVAFENVVLDNIHQGVWLDAGSELSIEDVSITTDVFDEYAPLDTHAARPTIVQMSGEEPEAGFVVREQSAVQASDVDLTLTGTGVNRTFADGTVTTYPTIGAFVIQDSSFEVDGFHVGKATFGAAAFDSRFVANDFYVDDALIGFQTRDTDSQFRITNSTLTGAIYDIDASEAEGEVVDSTVNSVWSTSYRRWPTPDLAPTTSLTMRNVAAADGPVKFVTAWLSGETFTLEGYEATLGDQSNRYCSFNGAGTIRDAVIEDCEILRNSRLDIPGVAGIKSGLGQNLRIENSHLLDVGLAISVNTRSNVDENTTVVEDTVLDRSTVTRTCCQQSDPRPPSTLSLEQIDVTFEDVTFRNSPQAIQFSWGWVATLNNVAFQDSAPVFDLEKSPGATEVHAQNVTADGLPVITEGGHVSGGTYGGVLLPHHASSLTVEGAEIRGFGIRAWGQEDLKITDAVIQTDAFPLLGYRLAGVHLADTSIVDGVPGLCTMDSRDIQLTNVSLGDSGFAPGRCTDPSEVSVDNVTAGGAPVIHDPVVPVTGEVGQVLAADQDVAISGADLQAVPVGVIHENGNLTIRNTTSVGTLAWLFDGDRLVVENTATRMDTVRGQKALEADGTHLWFDDFRDEAWAIRAEQVPNARITNVTTQGSIEVDALGGFTSDRQGSAHVSDLELESAELKLQNHEQVSLRDARFGASGSGSAADGVRILSAGQAEIHDVFLEGPATSVMTGMDALNITHATFEGRLWLALGDPPTRTGEPSLSPLVNETWHIVDGLREGAPTPEDLAFGSALVRQLEQVFMQDPPETFYELEQKLKSCPETLRQHAGFCPVRYTYESVVDQLVARETTTLTNGHIHRSNLLGPLQLEDGKINATDNWWGQPGGPREDQVRTGPRAGGIETDPAAAEPINQPPTVNVRFQGEPVANKTVLVDVQAQDDHRDVEDVTVEIGGSTLTGSGPIVLPEPGTIDWRAEAVDGFGATGTADGSLEVLPEPDATIHTAPDQPRVNGTLQAQLDGPTEAYDIEWDLGATGSTDATGPEASFELDATGTYALQARLVHEGSTLGTSRTHVTVSEEGQSPPNVTVDASPRTGEAPLEVEISGHGYDNDGFLRSWELRVDGTVVEAGAPPFTGAQLTLGHGTHTATLAYTDDENLTGTADVPISVDTAPVEIDAANLTLDGALPEIWIAGDEPALALETSDADADRVHLKACVQGAVGEVCTSATQPTGPANLTLPPLPAGHVVVAINAWDGQGSQTATATTLQTQPNQAPTLDPRTPNLVEAGTEVQLQANAEDPEARPLATSWTTPWTALAGDQVTVEPEGWGLKTLRATATDTFEETTTRTAFLTVDASLGLEAEILPVGPNGYAVPLRTSWIGAGAVHADVSAQLTWNGLVLDEDQARTGPSGVTILYLEDRTQGAFPSGYQVTVDARTPSPPDDAEPGLERASLTMEVTP